MLVMKNEERKVLTADNMFYNIVKYNGQPAVGEIVSSKLPCPSLYQWPTVQSIPESRGLES